MKHVLVFFLFLFESLYAYNVSRMIVIADVHGDIPRLQTILQDANVIDINNKWIATNHTLVIQLGDQIDPKDVDSHDIPDKHHFAMIYYTHELKKQAIDHNSDFISHIGNHEYKHIDKIRRKIYLREIIAFRPIVSIQGKYLFCHGGFKLRHYYLLNIYNKTMDDLNDIWFKYVVGLKLTAIERVILQNLIMDKQDGILYTRTDDDKYAINKLLDIMNLDYIFVGHTETTQLHVTNKIWHLDMVLKTAFDAHTYNYLIIENDQITIKSLSNPSNNSIKPNLTFQKHNVSFQ